MVTQKMKHILSSDPSKKYKYFINKVVDEGVLWSLYDDGWAISQDEDGKNFIPLWPDNDFALNNAKDNWLFYKPKSIQVYDFINQYIDELINNKMSVSIFYESSKGKGLIIPLENLRKDLKYELSRVE